MTRNNGGNQKTIEQYTHENEERLNNPPVGLVTPDTDKDLGKKQYQYDPHLDPQLVWAGKAEHTSFEVPTVSLHVHERIDPKRIIEQVKKEEKLEVVQESLFAAHERPLREAVEFYKHKDGWTNRLIAGDSLLVMNSLIEKEGMGEKVQMVYFDPPYGIKYGSNFQPFVNKRDVKDGKDEDLSAEPEMIKAFRDTWEIGIHSYLTYIRDRLFLAKECLSSSGSVFVQISDENIHRVRNIMDEAFGSENFCALIPFRKRLMPLGATLLEGMCDYLLWYAKSKQEVKYRHLYRKTKPLASSRWTNVELPDGTRRKLTKQESDNLDSLPNGSKVYRLVSQRKPEYFPDNDYVFTFKGKEFKPPRGGCWMMTKDKMEIIAKKGRLEAEGENLSYVLYHEDFPYSKITSFWTDTAPAQGKRYVVQTADSVVTRCMLMTSDPGDLILDITCGSGVTANTAEQLGRRWVTCDTSRIALTLAKQHMMTSAYDYFELAQKQEGISSGFKYKTAQHITLKSLANNEPPTEETMYDQPYVDNNKSRVTGPFTVEAVPAPTVKSFDDIETEDTGISDTSVTRSGETRRQSEWRQELLKTGVRGKNGQFIKFSRIEPMSGTLHIQAEGETTWSDTGSNSVREEPKGWKPQKVLICFGPEHAPLEQRTVEMAWQEARAFKPDLLLFCAFQFDEEAAKDIDELPPNVAGMQLLKVQMNADLLTDDLRKKRSSNESFWLIGQPEVEMRSFEFLVFSDTKERMLCEYGTFKKLSGLDSLAEINKLGENDILLYAILSQGRDVWDYLANEKSWSFGSGKHSGRTGKKREKGVPAVSWNSARVTRGIGNIVDDLGEFGVSSEKQLREVIAGLRRDSSIAGSIKKIALDLNLSFTKNSKLTTKNFSQIEVLGFDYYNPKTGNVESGSKNKIAMWMLDTNYDGRSLFPSQVFFPMAGAKEGWATLARNLKAEIDEDKIEAFRGTESLPFEPGNRKTVAVKIVDDRGIESLKIIRI